MGYRIYTTGELVVRFASEEDRDAAYTILKHICSTRREKLDPSKLPHGDWGEDGELYPYDAPQEAVVDSNVPPGSQPALYCEMEVDIEDEHTLVVSADGIETTAYPEDWIEYMIEKIIFPNGGVASGDIAWEGDEDEDRGVVFVRKNKHVAKAVQIIWPTLDEGELDDD